MNTNNLKKKWGQVAQLLAEDNQLSTTLEAEAEISVSAEQPVEDGVGDVFISDQGGVKDKFCQTPPRRSERQMQKTPSRPKRERPKRSERKKYREASTEEDTMTDSDSSLSLDSESSDDSPPAKRQNRSEKKKPKIILQKE